MGKKCEREVELVAFRLVQPSGFTSSRQLPATYLLRTDTATLILLAWSEWPVLASVSESAVSLSGKNNPLAGAPRTPNYRRSLK